MKAYRHLYFDLDHTLWDFETNSRETLTELHAVYGLEGHGVAAGAFVEKYFEINALMWSQYHRGLIDRSTLRAIRFRKTFEHFNVPDENLCRIFPEAYLQLLPTKRNLFPGSEEMLRWLGHSYGLHLITNGFLEVQEAKLLNSGLHRFFREVIISEAAGSRKPEKAIFDHALARAGARREESLMIGDDLEADIQGALKAGWDAVFFNPDGKEDPFGATHEIRQLTDLKRFL